MKQTSLFLAAAVILVANALALLHARGNRRGPVESDITLTERELSNSYDSAGDNSGVSLTLQWVAPRQWFMPDDPPPWLNAAMLHQLGFDTSVPATDQTASDFYQRQRARRAFVALECDGAGWRDWIDQQERRTRKFAPAGANYPNIGVGLREASTRLVAIDAASEAAQLRERHPDRTSVMVVPAVIRIGVMTRAANVEARIYGWIEEIPSQIKVPLPFSDAFRRLPRNREGAKYRVRLRYGASLEPWIAAVEFLPSDR